MKHEFPTMARCCRPNVAKKSGLLETKNIACEKDRIYAGDVDFGSYIVKAI